MADRLRLRVNRDGHAVTILVNGRRLDGEVRRAYQGFHPAELLDPEIAPLIPADPAARVAVYLCTCGHTGCGCIAPVIARVGDQVTWTDFRDLTGAFDGPTTTEVLGPDWGEALPVPDYSFDAGQYLAEVERATADRWWETPALLAVRLLRGHLDAGREQLAALGWTRQYVSARRRPGTFFLTFTDADDHQICVELTAEPASPQLQAAQLSDFLLTTSPTQWPVTFCNFCGREYLPGPGQTRAEFDAELARHPAHAPPRGELDDDE